MIGARRSGGERTEQAALVARRTSQLVIIVDLVRTALLSPSGNRGDHCYQRWIDPFGPASAVRRGRQQPHAQPDLLGTALVVERQRRFWVLCKFHKGAGRWQCPWQRRRHGCAPICEDCALVADDIRDPDGQIAAMLTATRLRPASCGEGLRSPTRRRPRWLMRRQLAGQLDMDQLGEPTQSLRPCGRKMLDTAPGQHTLRDDRSGLLGLWRVFVVADGMSARVPFQHVVV